MNDYQLRQGDRVYIFSTCIVENGIKLVCKNSSGKLYSREFSILDLKSIDPIFNVINSEQEAIKYIDKALNIHKVGVTEEGGIIKIIFYITTKGLIHSIEIPLGESGKSLLQSKIENLSKENGIASSSAEAVETSQPIEVAPQTYVTGEINSYGQQSTSYNPPIITPVEEDTTAGSNFNVNEYISQIQTSNGGVSYDKYQTQNYTSETNVENIGSFMLQNNNQYTQTNYETTNVNMGSEYIPTGNDNKGNSYEYTSNQYTTSTDNNYIPVNYDTTYQATSTSYETNSLNIPTNYENITNQYNQPTQDFQEYQTTASLKQYDNTLPTITPVDDDFQSNKTKVVRSQYQTYSTPVINSYLHLNQEYAAPQYETNSNIVSNTQFGQELYSTQYIPEETNNNYFQQTTTTTRTVQSTSQYNPPIQGIKKEENLKVTLSLPREEKKVQLDINDLELQNLRAQAGEVSALKAKLPELEFLKKQLEEMNSLKSQLLELNELRAKVAELNSVKSQLEELNNLKQQLGQMNILKKQLEDLNELRAKAADTEILKRKLEELEKSKLEYEQELRLLREAKTSLTVKTKVEESKGLESKQLTFEDKPEQICVKGDIIHDTDELEMITRKINKLNKKLTLNLLYKATADSDKAVAFHGKCDDAKSTIVLVETDKGKRFGGYTTCSWRGECIDKKDEDAFVFSLDKMKTYDNIAGEDAIGCYPKFGPIFMGCQIRIYDNAFTRGGTTFEKGLNFNTEEDFELTDGERTFNVKEIEVYEVIPQ